MPPAIERASSPAALNACAAISDRTPARQWKITGLRGVDRLRLRREPVERDVPRAGDPARLPLVRLAHVDHGRAAVGERLRGLLAGDLDLRIAQRVRQSFVTLTAFGPLSPGSSS